LLRRGALRTLVALPAKAAAPHAVPMHLWVLRRPEPKAGPATHALLIDAAESDIDAILATVLAAHEAFRRGDKPDIGWAVPVIELLDQDIDLTPSRRQLVTSTIDPAAAADSRERLVTLLAELPLLLPRFAAATEPAPAPETSIGELAKSGALRILGPLDPGAEGEIDPQIGDVLIPIGTRHLAARIVEHSDVPVHTRVYLLRPNPLALDSWFLAGQLRTSANERRAASVSGAHRMDVRRVRIPRVPIEQQQRLGVAFRRLLAFEEAMRQVTELGADLMRVGTEGLGHGTLRLEDENGQPGESRT
jgi:hypothetical protein